ncbi:MAG: hypothetical protein ABIP34_08265 [Rhodoferax sp.]|uniref:hypothetical protein n=1 Tax=Rhodoferax sp. TaxID=50421 RepID=UPI003262D522
MDAHEPVHLADSLRGRDAALKPDPRTQADETLEGHHQRIAQFQLLDTVPYAVRVHFETAKNVYLYAWFVYRFYPVAEQYALTTMEFALCERLKPLFPQMFKRNRSPGLKVLIEKANVEGLISNKAFAACHRVALQKARERVSDEALRLLQEGDMESVEFDYDSARTEPGDFPDVLSVYAETLPYIRNMYAHGSSALHRTVLGIFETATDLVNGLYAQTS